MNAQVTIYTEEGALVDETVHPYVKQIMGRGKLKSLDGFCRYTADDLVGLPFRCSMRHLMVIRDALQSKGLKLKGD